MSMRSARKSRRRNHAVPTTTEEPSSFDFSPAPTTDVMMTPENTPSRRGRADDGGESDSDSSFGRLEAPPSSSKKSRRGRRESRAHSLSVNQAQRDHQLVDQHLDGTNPEHVEALIRDLEDQVSFVCVVRGAPNQKTNSKYRSPPAAMPSAMRLSAGALNSGTPSRWRCCECRKRSGR